MKYILFLLLLPVVGWSQKLGYVDATNLVIKRPTYAVGWSQGEMLPMKINPVGVFISDEGFNAFPTYGLTYPNRNIWPGPSSFFADDSSRSKISVTINAKDCEYIALLFDNSNKYEDIDSITRSKFRVASPPTGNTNVTIDSIEQRVWLDIDNRLAGDYIALTNNVFKRVDDAIRLAGGTWIINKLNRAVTDRGDEFDLRRQIGRKYLRKQED